MNVDEKSKALRVELLALGERAAADLELRVDVEIDHLEDNDGGKVFRWLACSVVFYFAATDEAEHNALRACRKLDPLLRSAGYEPDGEEFGAESMALTFSVDLDDDDR